MVFLLTLVFALTLLYLAITERTKRYITLLALQGFLLSLIAYFHLHEVSWGHLIFVLLETLALKAIVAPLFLEYIRKHNHLSRTSDSVISPIAGLLLTMLCIVFSFVISAYLHDSQIQSKFFAVAISTILTGFLLIIFHKNVFTHLVGYLVMENGIFILSLAVGNEMPMMINAAILLDIFIGILVLGLFLNRVGDAFKGTETEFLSQLKD
jgi:hydrogenase-4 component E